MFTMPGSRARPNPYMLQAPRGTVMLFYQAAAPHGWTKLTTQNDKTLRVVSGSGGVSGGTNSFSTVMAQTVVGGHSITTAELPLLGFVTDGGAGPEATSTTTPVRFVQVTSGGGTAHNHTITMGIQYIDIILASKN